MKIVGTPIEGVEGWATELALFFADAVAAEARTFNQQRALQGEIARVREAIAQAQGLVRSAEEQAAAASRATSELATLPRPAAKEAAWMKPLAAGGGLVLGVAGLFTFWPVGVLAIAAGVAAWLWAERAVNREEAERASRMSAAQGAAGEASRARDAQAALLGQHEARARELEQQIAATRPQARLRGVARLTYPVSTLTVGGYPLLVDRGGSSKRVPIQLPDLAADADALARIQDVVDRAKATPILLRPSGEGTSQVSTLHGEESELRQAVEDFTEMVESIPTFEEQLPILPKDSPLATYVESRQGSIRADEAPSLVITGRSSAQEETALRRVSDLAARLRGAGRQVDAALRSIHKDLDTTLEAYRDLRSDALRGLHTRLTEVMHRSDMAYVRYYCPKCNRVPAYLFDRLGIDIERAHTLGPSEVVEALQRDPEVAERVANDEQLRDDINQAWASIREVDANLKRWIARKQEAEATAGADLAEMRAFESRLRALRAQQAQAIEQFRACLRKAVTGSARPTLELSRQATLFLDPRAEEWTCGACEARFDDPAIARMGRMLRVKDELLMPMWNHLWTEKDDFRKRELFRTNEQIQALIEKETGALRDVAEQYRADMRPVRENLILASMEAMNKREQLEGTVMSLEAMGVVSKAERESSASRLDGLTGGDLGDLKKRAESKETLLSLEPQAQMSRRLPAVDPVQMHLTPDVLFRHDEHARDEVRVLRGLAAQEGAS